MLRFAYTIGVFNIASQLGLGARQGGGAGPSRLPGPTRAITPTLCARKAPGLHAQLGQLLMYVRSAWPTCTIGAIIGVGETRPAYMQAVPEPPFCILLITTLVVIQDNQVEMIEAAKETSSYSFSSSRV